MQHVDPPCAPGDAGFLPFGGGADVDQRDLAGAYGRGCLRRIDVRRGEGESGRGQQGMRRTGRDEEWF
jgi:hypothetical protein